MLSLNSSGFACSYNEANLENLRHDNGGKKEFGANRSRRGRFYNVLSCLHFHDPIKTFWTFTVPELQTDYEQTDRFLTKQFGAVLQALRQRYDRGQPNGLKNYCWVSEAQTRGNIHYHLVTSTKYLDVLYVQDIWNSSIGQHSKNSVHVDPVDESDIKNVSAYFAKYMSKRKPDEQDLKARVIFARSFGYSKNFPIVDKISVTPKELLKTFPDLQEKKITKKFSEDVEVDYYFLDSKKVYELMIKKTIEIQEILTAETIGFI